MNKLKITSEQAGQRLDKFLSDIYKEISRSKIQKLIKSENIFVNDKKILTHYFLKLGDIVSVNFYFKEDAGIPLADFLFWQDKIRIVAETDEYLVINKPSGLIVHGAEHIKDYTLADWLIKKYSKIKKVGEDSARPGIVHRLDKEVSGLMVVAKTQDSFNNLKEQFQKRKIKKEYIALAYGKIEKDEDEINFPIKRSGNGYKMVAVPTAVEKSRTAVTEFEIIKKFINYTLLKVKIKTGRTHQIRVHLLAYGHPIVGDNLYNTKKTREQNIKVNLKRIFLVADKLSFHDLKGETQSFETGLPKELEKFLGEIK